MLWQKSCLLTYACEGVILSKVQFLRKVGELEGDFLEVLWDRKIV